MTCDASKSLKLLKTQTTQELIDAAKELPALQRPYKMEKGDKHPGTIIGVKVAIELVKIALKHTCLNCYANTSRDVKSNYLTCPNGCPSGSFYKQGAEGDQWRVVDALRLYYLLKLGLEYDECT